MTVLVLIFPGINVLYLNERGVLVKHLRLENVFRQIYIYIKVAMQWFIGFKKRFE